MYDRVRGIYEYIQENCNYAINSNLERDYVEVSTAYAALVKKRAVCSGFSAAFTLLCQRMGYRCFSISGLSSARISYMENHQWNILWYRDSFYHFDCTWDTNMYEVSKCLSYEYFFRNDAFMKRSHVWDSKIYPECISPKCSIYYRKKYMVCSYEDVYRIINSALENNETVIRFQFMDKFLFENGDGTEIMKKITDDSIFSKIYKNNRAYSYNQASNCGMVIIK